MSESIKSRLTRYLFNFAPVLRGTGMWISYISSDWREIRVKLPLTIFTRNYVGTIFGGSIYSSVDPFYMLMLIKNLGKDYVVWDKAASIKFIRPGRSTIRAVFKIDNELLQEIRNQIVVKKEMEINLLVQYLDPKQKLVAEIDKLIYIADKDFYKQKRAGKSSHH